MMDTANFIDGLEQKIQETCRASGRLPSELRPFICDGNPLDCGVFTVGTNPASEVSWESFWNKKICSFDKTRWFETYKSEKLARGRKEGKLRPREVSPTRKRIGLVVNELLPHKCFETNIYSYPTKSESDLMLRDRVTFIFDYLLNSIRPKVLHLEGDVAIGYFENTFGINIKKETLIKSNLGFGPVCIYATSHFNSREKGLTDEKIITWGQIMKSIADENID